MDKYSKSPVYEWVLLWANCPKARFIRKSDSFVGQQRESYTVHCESSQLGCMCVRCPQNMAVFIFLKTYHSTGHSDIIPLRPPSLLQEHLPDYLAVFCSSSEVLRHECLQLHCHGCLDTWPDSKHLLFTGKTQIWWIKWVRTRCSVYRCLTASAVTILKRQERGLQSCSHSGLRVLMVVCCVGHF